MRIFEAERVSNLMKRIGMKEDEAIEHRWVSKIIENAQRKVERYHFDIRKQLLEFDDVANDQRKVIYKQRTELLMATNIAETIALIREDVMNQVIDQYIVPQSLEEQWDIEGLQKQLVADYNLTLDLKKLLAEDATLDEQGLRAFISKKLTELYQAKEELAGAEVMRQFEKNVMLQMLDLHWKEHLSRMDYLRRSVHLSGYAQKNPKQEYKKEAFILFKTFLDRIKLDVVKVISLVQIQLPEEVAAMEEERRRQAEAQKLVFQHASALGNSPADQENANAQAQGKATPMRRDSAKISRNALCPCGSGKKYKHCCGKL
jgi:preprotein translocase subunit SecA